jgi:hypothetical protein
MRREPLLIETQHSDLKRGFKIPRQLVRVQGACSSTPHVYKTPRTVNLTAITGRTARNYPRYRHAGAKRELAPIHS